MRKKAILITGAAGEIGQALIEQLSARDEYILLSLDLHPLPARLDGRSVHILGDILDQKLFARLVTEYEFDSIFHLAALLSTRSEFSPELAHQVNVNGTLNLLQLAAEQSQQRGKPVRFMFPSSIAVYGMPDLDTKQRDFYVREWDWNYPTTMYGCNKLYCEQLGSYYSQNYQQLAETTPTMLDFRSLRFPGLISAFTVPSGGTSDYGPEMLHAAAKGVPYSCFVREDSTIPFMAMPDAITSLLRLWEAPHSQLSRTVYNVTSFSLSAAEFKAQVEQTFPQADISFAPDVPRQGIVDSWPAGLNDKQARKDWGWQPEYDVARAFEEYLVPNIRERYR
ncbi:MAG: NAD-dependent epimerase/dehydratase family protein [Ardenticatenaceae bacterium]|nr:NAD-dependent epimerase/dehydratase family protein [Anaerolineales bacterium]MCB9008018.1 NAD-dependent epimerase/dehydratase family protein [Ardenticatenaceae bacterium]